MRGRQRCWPDRTRMSPGFGAVAEEPPAQDQGPDRGGSHRHPRVRFAVPGAGPGSRSATTSEPGRTPDVGVRPPPQRGLVLSYPWATLFLSG